MDDPTVADAAAPILRMEAITKKFGAAPVLRGVDFDVRRGEVHALLGGNGAGKSTLMKILMGVYSADSGRIFLDGTDMTGASAAEILHQGVAAMIFQELSLLENMTVADNIFLGREPLTFGVKVDRRRLVRQAAALIEAQGFDIPATARVGELPFAQRQLVEIIKATSRGARVLVMDEPTSSLTAREEEKLFTLIARLTADGIGIVYISHRMGEIFRVSDRVTVLRDGVAIGPIPIAQATVTGISEYLSRPGAPAANAPLAASGHPAGHDAADGMPATHHPPPALTVRHLSTGRTLRDVSFEIAPGEILGIAGLVGAGRSTLAKAVAGLIPDVTGGIAIGGRPVALGKAHDTLGKGLGFVPEDRRHEGLVVMHSLANNLALPNLQRLSRGGALGICRRRAIRRLFANWAGVMSLVSQGADQPASELSGGNQQKVVFAKWLASRPRVLVLDEPTAGVDVGTKAEMRAVLTRAARDEGVGILLINSELDELAAICDRVLMMDGGRIVGTLDPRLGETAFLAALLARTTQATPISAETPT